MSSYTYISALPWDDLPDSAKYAKSGARQGWMCPGCRVVHAPWVPHCKCQVSLGVTVAGDDDGARAVVDFSPDELNKTVLTRIRGDYEIKVQRLGTTDFFSYCFKLVNGTRATEPVWITAESFAAAMRVAASEFEAWKLTNDGEG